MKTVFVPLSVFILSGFVWAMPCIYGLRGLCRIVDARIVEHGAYSFAFSAHYQHASVSDELHFQPADFPEIDTLLFVEDQEHYFNGILQIGFGIMDYAEMGISAEYLVNAYQYQQIPPREDFVGLIDGTWGFGDLRISLKGSYDVMPWLTAGGVFWYSFPLSETHIDSIWDYDGFWNNRDPRYQVRRPFTNTGNPSWGFIALATGIREPVEGHLNIGFSNYRQTWEDSTLGNLDRTDSSIDFGLGLSLPMDAFILFAEYTAKFFSDRGDVPGYSAPQRLTGGIRLIEDTGVFMDIGGEINLSSGQFDRRISDPCSTGVLPIPGGVQGDWGIILSMGYEASVLHETHSGNLGRVCGTVTDVSTGVIIEATVSFPENAVSPILTKPESGFFSVPVQSGPVVIRVEAEDYTPVSATVLVHPGETHIQDFKLEKTGSETGFIVGTVTDEQTGSPIVAQITIQGVTESPVTSDSDGSFSINTPAGVWTVTTETTGYLVSSNTINVPAGETSILNITLRPQLASGTVLSFANIYFNSGSANLKPESYQVLDEIVTLLSDNPDVDVEIAGHTDSDGSDSFNRSLSEQRAQSVKNYLVQHGISSARLSATGFGESNPIESNSTPSGKAQNRRIEFIIRDR